VRDRRAVPVDLVELRAILERSRKRVIHIFAGATIALFPVELVGIVAAPSGFVAAVAWSVVASAVVIVVGWLWHRARARAIERLLAAIARGASLYRCEVTQWWFHRVIPIGYGVEMYAVDATKAREHLAFGFWWRRDVDRLMALVQDHVVAGPLPPIEVTLWRPAARGEGKALPVAKARVRSDDARP
jgi:hypothetical protein